MKLAELLYKTSLVEIIGSCETDISGIQFDSRKVGHGNLFVAIKGTQADGHMYIAQAVENGATAVICEQMPAELKPDVCYVCVRNSAESLGVVASNFYGKPGEQLLLVGITGTNGKTTIATLLYHLFLELGYKTGLISTVENRINEKTEPASHTTPDALSLNSLLNSMVEAGCSHVFMEVSSHAVVQHRISGLRFAGGVFTNLTHDHLDFHLTFDDYLKAKQSFFDELPPGTFALTNKDDRNGLTMVQNTRAKVLTYGLKSMVDYHGRLLENQFEGMKLRIGETEVWSHLVGGFNAYNLLAVYAAALALGEKEDEVLTKVSQLHPAEGRFNVMRSPAGVFAIVDYAHTPDAVENVLATINEIRDPGQKLVTVIGAGGDRDRAKRPKMAKTACMLSDKVILTTDNPRSEDPMQIIAEMKSGVDASDKRKLMVIQNRLEAIQAACHMLNPNDILLVAGKGHEKYQEIKGVKYPFDDKAIIAEALGIIEQESQQT